VLTRIWMLRAAVVAVALLLAGVPALAQEAPNSSADGATANQSDDSGTALDQSAQPAADPTPSATPDVDTQAVIAQWGSAPEMGHDADQAVARRWLREQQAYRARWDIPGVSRDLYLDWEATNALHSYLNEPPEPQPAGLTKPSAVQQSPESNHGIKGDQWYWNVSDDLWQAWLDSFQNQAPGAWLADHPDEPFFTRANYMQVKEWRNKPFDRFRLVGVAGRVDTSKAPIGLLPFDQQTLEQLAPGSLQAYQPVNYATSLVAIVAYDPWINPNGSMRP